MPVDIDDFEILKVLGTGAYGKVFLVRKLCGPDINHLYAMKTLKKSSLVNKPKTLEHTLIERKVLEIVRSGPFLATLHYAFQTSDRLHLVMGKLMSTFCFFLFLLFLPYCVLFSRFFPLRVSLNSTASFYHLLCL